MLRDPELEEWVGRIKWLIAECTQEQRVQTLIPENDKHAALRIPILNPKARLWFLVGIEKLREIGIKSLGEKYPWVLNRYINIREAGIMVDVFYREVRRNDEKIRGDTSIANERNLTSSELMIMANEMKHNKLIHRVLSWVLERGNKMAVCDAKRDSTKSNRMTIPDDLVELCQNEELGIANPP